MTLKKLFPK